MFYFISSSYKLYLQLALCFSFLEIFGTHMAMQFSNNIQIYSYANSASFAVLYFRVTSYNINLELFENFKASKRVLGVMEK